MTEHTESPWEIGYAEDWTIDGPGSFDYLTVIAKSRSIPIAFIPGPFRSSDAEEHARLIAGAPTLKAENERLTALNAELLEALEPITAACETDCCGPIVDDEPDWEPVGRGEEGPMALTFGMIRAARAAIKKATS